MAMSDDPRFVNVSTSIIQPSTSDDNERANLQSTADATGGLDDDDFSINSSLIEDYKRQQRESTQLQQDLAAAQGHISRLLEQMQNDSINHSNEKSKLLQETMRLNEEAAKAHMDQQQYNTVLEPKVKLHGDAIERLLRTPNLTNSNAKNGITSPIKDLLDRYDDLDDDSKKALFSSAISTNNVDLQRALLDIRCSKGNTGTTLAKLTKELIKLAETYKVPELRFEEQATKRRYNYYTWIAKLKSILAVSSNSFSNACG
jgi:hypothetical protein